MSPASMKRGSLALPKSTKINFSFHAVSKVVLIEALDQRIIIIKV